MNQGAISIPLYKYDHLVPGNKIEGPALIISSDTTILIYPNDIVNVDKYQNLLIDIRLT